MKIIEVIADVGHLDTISGIADHHEIEDVWQAPVAEDGRVCLRLLVHDDKRQAVLDLLQTSLSTSPDARILVQPVEAALPRKAEESETAARSQATREELYNSVSKDAHMDGTFFLLILLSTVVVAIGLLEDNVAVVIGAMVIAPLLGPNIALALGSALGDGALIWRALKIILSGLGFAILLGAGIGLFWPYGLDSAELLARTQVGLDSVTLALASGLAAIISLTTSVPSVLVGVMVAVALLPPATTLGVMLGSGNPDPATGAGLLLAVNVVCVNLAAQLGLFTRGIRPRTWSEKAKGRQSTLLHLTFWIVSLALLIAAIRMR